MKYLLGSSVLMLILGGALVFFVFQSTPPTDAKPKVTQPSGMMQSSDKVSVDATLDSSGKRIVLTLQIEDGWHVNATPASLDFLIPTTVQVRQDGKPAEMSIHYPPGRATDIVLAGKAIEVYDDGTQITVLPDPSNAQDVSVGQLDLVVTVQSCSDAGVCLAPSIIETKPDTLDSSL
ncbi:hypothetical protein EB809_08120 [Marinobacter sp. R17]|uniref:protein-disulfide reductase DsbD domain-containing protein n=1 Tax=Marinobacter sp. R17 TaxID=2484250 RepID=UPI000F4C24AF|nr:protein-disulfide reductase DsbD domain-containing protein [Marinobacter sp. R17]ROU00454.1 hypothetical protein EB809_08120 [Marinobacter sp. R17]